MRRRPLSKDVNIALRQMAQELATGSIVNDALARYLYQVLEFVYEEYIEPLRKENEELKTKLKEQGQ